MPRRIALTQLNASTIDILNVIRQNADLEYQTLVPEITNENEIVKVGEIIYGNPALSNRFLNALVNRIALVRVKSAVFNNAYAQLKKGYLEFGETVEEVFVNIAKAREFSAEKAEQRELKRSIPDVRSAFHSINWRVQYPVTIQDEDLKQAFMNINGVQDLIAKIVDSVYTGAEYDEFLLFKYLLIKAVAHGKMYPVAIGNTLNDSAVAFRGMSNTLTFMSPEYNASGVTTATPRNDQYIFMDSMFNAKYDVGVLASAFNMDKAEFQGKLHLIDKWDTFDNARFDEIRANCDAIEEITPEELAVMSKVKAILIDGEWFQVYDNHIKFTEKYVASGEYWNYFLNIKKTVSSSPFSNAVVFVEDTAESVEPKASYTVEVVGKSTGESATIFTLAVKDETAGVASTQMEFVQDRTNTEKGIAIHKYGAVIFPTGQTTTTLTALVEDVGYTSSVAFTTALKVGDTFTMNKNG